MLGKARKLITQKNNKKLATKARYMHTKINKHPIDPNFLTHVLWSKTNLGMQHIHLELPLILSYSITKKNKHISRINISDNYKIVNNPPEVYFGKER
jgi:mRNA-degrading endonuclease YafQ of YafQ-DinJ toxin-antitoxin module